MYSKLRGTESQHVAGILIFDQDTRLRYALIRVIAQSREYYDENP